MKFGRYKQMDWQKAYKRRLPRLNRMIELRAPSAIVELNARLVLEAIHRGPWRAIWALTKHELWSFWLWYGFFKWEWIRVNIFRLPQNADLAEVERLDEEDAAIEELAKQL